MKRFRAAWLLAALAGTQLSAQQAPTVAAGAEPWWKHAVFYEIYPRSFQDSNGDGVGDLNGMTSRLDYLQRLGVDAIWIAPCYPSPQVDFGYDVADYTAIDPQYGTLAEFDRLVAVARKHHIRVVLDMVLNHTSDRHKWFEESASSRTNAKADWYIWNDGKADVTKGVASNAHRGPSGWVVPPNNWSSLFQGSAWEWVEARGQFYYHFFYKQQPDLNWRNPAVEKAMFGAMRFWLDRGVAGFRLDAVTTLFEDPTLHDEPLTGKLDASGFPESNHTLTSGLPEVHDVLQRLHMMIASYPGDRSLIGEIYTANTAELNAWYGTAQKPELELPMDTLVGFHQEGDGITQAPNVSLSLTHFRKYLAEAQTNLNGHTPLLVFDNHDNTRSWDRFTTASETPEQKLAIAKIIATVLLTSNDAALLYYGEELGMTTETPQRKEDVRDPIGISGWPKEKGRDGERTPMQWDASAEAGFTRSDWPWLPVPANHAAINVSVEEKSPASLLRWYERLIALRRSKPALREGSTVFLDKDNPDVLTFVRRGTVPVLVAVNMSGEARTISPDLKSAGIQAKSFHVLDSSAEVVATSLSGITLPAYGSLITEIR